LLLLIVSALAVDAAVALLGLLAILPIGLLAAAVLGVVSLLAAVLRLLELPITRAAE
jgi:hypothetical protein